ncbi:MAG: hypothetical protein HYX71_09415 [Opitutae bacterium]|nr:hypothetical protein [Opitutae bacterium]
MNPDPALTAAPARPPRWLRLLRSLILIGLCLSLMVITALVVIGCLPAASASLKQLFSWGSKVPKGAVSLTVLFVILVPLIVLAVAERKRWLSWPVLAASCLVVLPVLGWLAWDEPAIRQPIAIEEFSPVFPGAEQSHAVLMQYSRQTPSEEAKAFAATKLNAPVLANPDNPAKWLESVTKNRAAIEADWATLAPQRRWFGELAAFERIGDLTPSDYGANIMSFQAWRTLSKYTCAMATLLALDGRGDEAIALLGPQLEVSRKLQLSSRRLTRTMIAEVVERVILQTAALVLDRTPVSAASRARLTAALAHENGPALARRLLLIEYVLFAPYVNRMKLGDHLAGTWGNEKTWLRRPLNFLSALFFNPVATTNIHGDHVRELAELAAARDLGRFKVRSGDFSDILLRQPGMKNVGGRLMLSVAVPAYPKILENHWKTADLRIGLRARLATVN